MLCQSIGEVIEGAFGSRHRLFSMDTDTAEIMTEP
jgi:hypothetical protein